MTELESSRASKLVDAISKLSNSPAKPLREDTYFRLPLTMRIADADLCAYLARSERSFLFLPDFDTFSTRLILKTTNEGWNQDKLPALAICPTDEVAKQVQKTTEIESVSADRFFRDLNLARPVTQTFTGKKSYVIGHDHNPRGRFDDIVLPSFANLIVYNAQDFSADELTSLCEPVSQIRGRLILCGDWNAMDRAHPDIAELISDTLGHGLPKVSVGNHPENTWEVGDEAHIYPVPTYSETPLPDTTPWVIVAKSFWEEGAYYVRSVYAHRTEALHSLPEVYAAEWDEHMFLFRGDITDSGDITVMPAEWRLSEAPEFGQRVRVEGQAVTALIGPDEELPLVDELQPDISPAADPLQGTQSFLVFHAKSGGSRSFPDDYKLVAKIEAENIDSALQLSQRNGRSWIQNPGVTAFSEEPRSTQVGDIVIEHDEPKRYLGTKGWCPATTTMEPVHELQGAPALHNDVLAPTPIDHQISVHRPKF